MTTNPIDLTVVIPAKNEEANISACLNSIGSGWAREIIVVDSSSSDSTVPFAKKSGASVINFVWNGKFPKKRNWFLRNYPISTKWVMFLDADEYLTEDFKNEVRAILETTSHVGFWLNYTNYFMGKRMRGGYPFTKLALFRVGAGEYEKIDEARWSHLDMEVHEHPILDGTVGVIKTKIEHNDFKSISHYIRKHNEYADWEANRYVNSLKQLKDRNILTWKQKLKYSFLGTPFIGVLYFIGSYIFMGGFLNGARGLCFSIFKMAYFTQVYCSIRDIKRNQTSQHL